MPTQAFVDDTRCSFANDLNLEWWQRLRSSFEEDMSLTANCQLMQALFSREYARSGTGLSSPGPDSGRESRYIRHTRARLETLK